MLRVAALVEISAAAATLARTIVKLRRLDPDLIAPHVADPVDLRAVLGRGRWLHTMTRPVPGHAVRPPSTWPRYSRPLRCGARRVGWAGPHLRASCRCFPVLPAGGDRVPLINVIRGNQHLPDAPLNVRTPIFRIPAVGGAYLVTASRLSSGASCST